MFNFSNFGDVNFVEHGGLFIAIDAHFEEASVTSYRVVQIDKIEDAENKWLLQDSEIFEDDVTEKHFDTMRQAGMILVGISNLELMSEVIRYFGHSEFSDPDTKIIEGEENVIKELKGYGIE